VRILICWGRITSSLLQVAAEAVKAAARDGIDVVLVDTAGENPSQRLCSVTVHRHASARVAASMF